MEEILEFDVQERAVLVGLNADCFRKEQTASEESLEVKWIPKEQVLDYVTTPVLRYRFENILHFDGQVTYASYVTKPEFRVLTERTI